MYIHTNTFIQLKKRLNCIKTYKNETKFLINKAIKVVVPESGIA